MKKNLDDYIDLARLCEAALNSGSQRDILAVIEWDEAHGDEHRSRGDKYYFPEFALDPIYGDDDDISGWALTRIRDGAWYVRDWQYNYAYLRGKALYTRKKDDLLHLAEWLETFDDQSWNGERWDIDGYELIPIYKDEYDEDGDVVDSKLVGVELF